MNSLNYSIVFIKKEYFNDFILTEVLNAIEDCDKRGYLCLMVKYENNNIFIPLRSNLPSIRKYGIIGFPLPTQSKPHAGLDFRKLLIINNLNYIEIPPYSKIPNSQQRQIIKNIDTIESQVISYIDGYKKSFIKNRTKLDKKYKYSSLCNYHNEINLEL